MSYLKTSFFSKILLKTSEIYLYYLTIYSRGYAGYKMWYSFADSWWRAPWCGLRHDCLGCGMWMDGPACPGTAQASGCFAGLCLLSSVSATALRGICQLQAQRDLRNTAAQTSHKSILRGRAGTPQVSSSR